MTTPTYLPNTDPNANWASSVEVRLRSTTATHAIYGAWNPANSTWWNTSAVHSIKVGTDSTASDYDTWTDEGSLDPTSVTEANGNISLWDGSVLNYVFAKPTTASWIPTSSPTTFATLTSSTSTPASGTQTHSYVPDSVRNIQFAKTASYQFTVSWQHADIFSMGTVIYYVRKNGQTVDQISDTFAAADGSYAMVITSSTIYPNAKIDNGDVITLHASDAVSTENPDGSFSLRSAGAELASFTYTAVDVQATLSSGRIGDTLNVQVWDRALYPDYQNWITFSYLPYNPPSTYTGGSTTNLTSVITGIHSSGGPKLQTSNNYVITGTWEAGKDGVQQTNRKGTLVVTRKTPAPVQAQITAATFQVFGGESTMQGGQRNFW